jgi:hypothetical protein
MGENQRRAEHLLTARDLIARGLAVTVLIVGALLALLTTPGV